MSAHGPVSLPVMACAMKGEHGRRPCTNLSVQAHAQRREKQLAVQCRPQALVQRGQALLSRNASEHLQHAGCQGGCCCGCSRASTRGRSGAAIEQLQPHLGGVDGQRGQLCSAGTEPSTQEAGVPRERSGGGLGRHPYHRLCRGCINASRESERYSSLSCETQPKRSFSCAAKTRGGSHGVFSSVCNVHARGETVDPTCVGLKRSAWQNTIYFGCLPESCLLLPPPLQQLTSARRWRAFCSQRHNGRR